VLVLTRQIAAEPDLTRLLALLAASCSKALEVERSSIWVVDPKTGDLFTRVAEKMESIRVPAGKGIVGAVAADNRTLLIPDAYADGRFNPDVDKKTGFRTRQILCLPLHDCDGGRVVGVIQALNKADGKDFAAYDIEVASIIAAQAGVALSQAALREEAQERKRLQAEMNLAHSIQRRLLPRANPAIAGLDVAGHNRPATETSGDYYDYVTLSDGRLGVIIADVTGHGLGAALLMTSARAFVRALCATEKDPARILSAANNLLEQDLENGNFLSLCLAAFDPQTLMLEYASAGHDPPMVYRPAENSFAELESTGPLLGILPGAEFANGGPLPLQKGDVLLFMTDGLFECMNDSGETMGKERVADVLRAHAASDAESILAALLAAADAWTADQPPRDDITLVVAKRL
jgi:serine phosphatase RsbU (regulator of sigma subunit)